MLNQFSRTELLLGHDGMEKLAAAGLPFSVSAVWAATPRKRWPGPASARWT